MKNLSGKIQLTWNTADEWASAEAARALANRLMIFRVAEGSVTAWIRIDAWIDASIIATHAIAGAVGVGVAFGWINGVRISGN